MSPMHIEMTPNLLPRRFISYKRVLTLRAPNKKEKESNTWDFSYPKFDKDNIKENLRSDIWTFKLRVVLSKYSN